MAYLRGEPWDTLALSGRHARASDQVLREVWGIDDLDSWRGAVERMLDEENVPQLDAIVLQHRPASGRVPESESESQPESAPAPGAEVAAWRDHVEQLATGSGWSAVDAAEAGARAGVVHAQLQKVRRAGLPEDVDSVHGYNYSRAVNLARWGLAAGYTDEAGAHTIVRRAGEAAQRRFDGWPAFGASYAMGRALAFEADRDESVQGSPSGAELARRLLEDADGAWATTPWPASR